MTRKPKDAKDCRSIDGHIDLIADELAQQLDADVVKEVAEEVREQLKDELRERLARKAKLRQVERRQRPAPKEEEEEFVRFSALIRAQHIVLMISCVSLIITGLPLKFPEARWAELFFGLMGGVGVSGAIHRIGATGLILVGVFHLFYIGLTREGRREFRELIPKPKDVRDVYNNVRYFLGRSARGARFGRFSYIEKFDYWAVYWGMVVMITSGLMLWFVDHTMMILPKFFLDMAREAHSDEALLATLAIIIWHMYNVHLNPDNFPMNRTWLTGKLTKTQMLHHHPLEYEQIMTERAAVRNNGGRNRRDTCEEGSGQNEGEE